MFDEEGAAIVHDLMVKAEKKGVKIILPTDFVTADKFSKDAQVSWAARVSDSLFAWISMREGGLLSKTDIKVFPSPSTGKNWMR